MNRFQRGFRAVLRPSGRPLGPDPHQAYAQGWANGYDLGYIDGRESTSSKYSDFYQRVSPGPWWPCKIVGELGFDWAYIQLPDEANPRLVPRRSVRNSDGDRV